MGNEEFSPESMVVITGPLPPDMEWRLATLPGVFGAPLPVLTPRAGPLLLPYGELPLIPEEAPVAA